MVVASKDPDIADPSKPSVRDVPELTADPLGFARGCLIAAGASAVFWLVSLWLVVRGH
jgi:hypothetical protein